MSNEYYEGTQARNTSSMGRVLRAVYLCSSCRMYHRYFLLKFDQDATGRYIAKVGQDPAWDITLDRNLENELGKYSDYYRKGLICESQSYGIGAFAYYRRIVEEIIEKLLEDIPQLMAGEEREKYIDALKQVEQTKRADEKIKLVKDLLPSILKPNGRNPLGILYDALSGGLHAENDELCVELAQQVREVLVYLVNRLLAVKTTDAQFTEGMKKLLDRKKE